MLLSLEAIIVISGWLISLAVALKAVPALAARRVSEQFGLELVVEKGKKMFVPVGPDGEPIQIPIGVKEVDGKSVVVMGYAPLAYCLPYLAADMAAIKVKMALLGAKGQISQAIKGKALAEGDMDALMAMLPKKVQGAVAIARMLGIGKNQGQDAGESGGLVQSRQSGGQK